MDEAEQLWITLLKIHAETEKIDISHIPECVLEHYAHQGITVKEAIEQILE